MPNDKDIKKDFRLKAQREPEANYPVKTLKSLGFSRQQCNKCKNYFWATQSQSVCGDSFCRGGFSFIGNSPAKKQLDYIETWKVYKKIHEKLGYTAIDRYPVVARWRNDTDFVAAGIYDFQPYVISGEVEPPANPVIEAQFCLRFNDIDNVGITGAHYSGFDMLGEHAFFSPEKFDKNKYISDHLTWLNLGMGLSNDEISIHEDAWAGGGNFGPSMEFFARGLELSNQVYMQYEITPSGPKKLALNVLDMGQGHERVPWFTQGQTTSYETTFPSVLKKLKMSTGIKVDFDLMPKFLPYAGLLNADEAEDLGKTWNMIARKVGLDVKELKSKIIPLSAMYSIAEHSRSLLVALNDGALPSNVGGMYNLRILLRRALTLNDKYEWNIHLPELCRMHAKYLKPLYPELTENLDNVSKILEIEKEKYKQTKQKIRQIISRVVERDLNTNDLIDLYDSQGISPDLIKDEAKKLGKKIEVPDNFYALVSEKHEKREKENEAEKNKQKTKTQRTHKIETGELPSTEILYFGDWDKTYFSGKVLKIIGQYVVLDKSLFYPVSGGQMQDQGTMEGIRVVDVFKQGNLIIHKLESAPEFKEGDIVVGEINHARRKQLTQHHTATHIINAATKRILGSHINQASAKKDLDHAYIDVTHYQQISEAELEAIETEANKIINEKIKIEKSQIPRTKAEQKYGMEIYQGGAVPGKVLRIVSIPGVDTEACGGTHLNNTSEADIIKILKTNKVKDGVVRINFTAGGAARFVIEKEHELVKELSFVLDVEEKYVVHRAEELFLKWKKARKLVKKNKKIEKLSELNLVLEKEHAHDIPEKTAELIGSQTQHLIKTIKRFLSELAEFKEKLKKLN